jgi:hypothetical protein
MTNITLPAKLIDAHGHLWFDQPETSKQTVLRLCETYNVYKTFISTLCMAQYYPGEEEVKQSNNITHSFMRENPGMIEGLAYINPVNDGCVDELKRCVEDLGMRGIKIWVAVHCDDTCVNRVAEAAIAYDIPVLAHTFKKTVGQIITESTGPNAANLGLRYPELKLIAAHLGGNVYETIKCIKDTRNICVDFSGSMFRRDDLDYTVRHLGVERVLFGSDMPLAFENCIGQVEGADLCEADKRKIYHDNAVRLFKLGGDGA